ncbi:hypothetical protein [Halorhabdus rudnickae]|uniref:hypothetical protein n=1 Tax=Halorhabdus rudnickae TaxID=1775544 RepID=UPI0010843C58|nr:hypothetical protein [Halorhabdus rudnickae]
MRWRILAVALLAVTAGCNAIGGSEDRTTLTPAPVPEDPPEDGPGSLLAPGVWADGRVDPGQLAKGQRAALENRSFRWLSTQNRSGQVDNVTAGSPSHYLIVFENGTRYYRDTNQIADHRSEYVYSHLSVYANGTHQFVRARAFTAAGTEYTRTPVTLSAYRHIRTTTEAVEKYLSVETTTIETVTNEGRTRIRIVGEGAGPLWSDTVRDYTVRAQVTPSGIVTDLSAHYQTVTDDSVESVDYRFTFQQLGNVTVTQPEWLPEARNRTDEYPR